MRKMVKKYLFLFLKLGESLLIVEIFSCVIPYLGAYFYNVLMCFLQVRVSVSLNGSTSLNDKVEYKELSTYCS